MHFFYLGSTLCQVHENVGSPSSLQGFRKETLVMHIMLVVIRSKFHWEEKKSNNITFLLFYVFGVSLRQIKVKVDSSFPSPDSL